MALTLDVLRVIDAVERHGSFAAAADALQRVPSAVTYTVRKLERELDVALFDRSGHRAALTPAGAELLAEGRHLLRGAEALEARVRQVATGWESELRVAVDHLLDLAPIYDVLEAFYAERTGTRVSLIREADAGIWDSLVEGRADLAVGAIGEGPAGGGYTSRPLGEIEMIFAVSPEHPLAGAAEPLDQASITAHRAVVVGDTSRRLAPRPGGLLSDLDVLTVPDLHGKLQAQRRGLGVGYLPEPWVRHEEAAGRLVRKTVEGETPVVHACLAWRAGDQGKALARFVERLAEPETAAALLRGKGPGSSD